MGPKGVLNNCKTMETFCVFKVSAPIFAAYAEGKNFGKSYGYVPKPWV